MLHVHRSDDAGTLVRALADVLSSEPLAPLIPEVVSVPTQGIERWIAQELALCLGTAEGDDGVAANILFPSPARLVTEAISATVSSDLTSGWSEEQLVWSVLASIDASLDEDWMAVVARFVRFGGSRAIEGRRMEAALRIASLFASYDRERPELVRAWAGGTETGPDGAALGEAWAWQPRLWRLVRERVGSPSLAEALDDALERIAGGEVTLDLPARICVYGLTSLPVGHLQVLAALACQREVHLFVLHPSPSLWAAVEPLTPSHPLPLPPRVQDPTAGAALNPLLASWGRDARELQLVLAACGAPPTDHHPSATAEAETLLQMLQEGVRANHIAARPAAPGTRDSRPEFDPALDRSVQIHSCHGPTRQVEVLRDAILHLLAADPTLEPRDIVVMCPDIEAYAPLVEAAFQPDAAHDRITSEIKPQALIPAGIPDVRLRIADRSPVASNPLACLAVSLLSLARSRVTASAVLDFAALGPVHRRFRLNDKLLETMAGLVDEIEVSWGLDAEHRAEHGLPNRPERTWTEGLERLLAGLLVADRSVELVGSRLPLAGVEGEDLDVVDRLAELVSRIRIALTQMRVPMTPADWRLAVSDAVVSLGDTGPGEDWQWAALERQLDRLFTGAPEEGILLSLPEVALLLGSLGQSRPTRANHRTGDLTVCTLVPMRSVPYRVICLLGMDDGHFPRSASEDGDDVVALAPCVGNRDPNSEDRQLLLDALMAAQECLVITYSGHDERTNAPRPPAVPVAELLDAIDLTVRAAEGGKQPASTSVVFDHPLQPFDARNFLVGPGSPAQPWGFDRRMLRAARALQSGQTDGSAAPALLLGKGRPSELTLRKLKAFLDHPVRAFIDARLKFRYSDRPEQRDDTLPVELDGLGRWGVGQRLLEGKLDKHEYSWEALLRAEWGRGSLPPGNLGRILLPEIEEMVEAILAAVAASGVVLPARESRQVKVALRDGRPLTGHIGQLTGTSIAVVQYSRVQAKHIAAAYLRLLALSAAEPDSAWTAVLVGREPGQGHGVYTEVLGPIGENPEQRQDEATNRLEVIVDLHERGMLEPLPLASATSHAYAAASDPGRGLRDARMAWEEEWGFIHEAADAHHRLVFGGLVPFDTLLEQLPQPNEAGLGWPVAPTRFEVLALRLWLPILEVCRGGQ